MIEIKKVSKSYDNGVVALKNISFEVEKGGFVFLVGSSGAGKSTLIKMLIREVVPSTGLIKLNGRNITTMKRRDVPFLRRSTGVVFQNFRLLDNYTVFENVAFAMRVIGRSRKEIKKQVPHVLGLVGLVKKIDCMPNQLSGGEQQRVCLARALVNQPSLLIADEPTGNLDPNTSSDIIELFKMINIRGTTIIMATHDREIVNSMKKRVITLHDGKLIRDDARGVYDNDI